MKRAFSAECLEDWNLAAASCERRRAVGANRFVQRKSVTKGPTFLARGQSFVRRDMLLHVPILQMARLLHIGDAQPPARQSRFGGGAKRIPPRRCRQTPRRFEVEDFANRFVQVKSVTKEPSLADNLRANSKAVSRYACHRTPKVRHFWSAPAERSDDGALGCGVAPRRPPLVGLRSKTSLNRYRASTRPSEQRKRCCYSIEFMKNMPAVL